VVNEACHTSTLQYKRGLEWPIHLEEMTPIRYNPIF
ncbi:hypothetical protein A2U01_0113723, partial [Trifolium medium]|nr:hypothetical protein [Trifolium medium]